jgi:hypothetical protein
MQKLLNTFHAESLFHLVIIFTVFALTGSSAVYVAGPVLDFFALNPEHMNPWLYWPLRIAIIFPIYQCLLIIVGTAFGQFRYFWAFEKKFLRRIGVRLP